MGILRTEDLGSIYSCQIINILDGDTIDFNVSLGMGMYTTARVRLAGVDAPEIFGVKKTSLEYQRGFFCKLIVAEWLNAYGPNYYLQAEHKDIFGRWLGEVWRQVDEESLNDYLISKYYGNGAWTWYSQEILTNYWFDRNSVICPGGQVLQPWHNWGINPLLGFRSKQIL